MLVTYQPPTNRLSVYFNSYGMTDLGANILNYPRFVRERYTFMSMVAQVRAYIVWWYAFIG